MEKSHFSNFERKVIKYICDNPIRLNDKTLDRLMIKVFTRFFPEISISVELDSLKIRFFSLKDQYDNRFKILIDRKNSMSFRKRLSCLFDGKNETDRRNRIKSRILTVIFLFEKLCSDRYIIELNLRAGTDNLKVVGRRSVKQVEEIQISAKEFIRLSKCDYLIDERLKNLVKDKFLSIDNRNLKITQFALYFTIGLSLISIIPDSEDCYINTSNVRVRTMPVNTTTNYNVVSFLNYGESVEVIQDSSKYCLVKYSLGKENKYGWVDQSYISRIDLFDKVFSSKKLMYFSILVLGMGLLYLKIFRS
ncbi:SH3 domain-containing protein [Labilibaculum euxinus]